MSHTVENLVSALNKKFGTKDHPAAHRASEMPPVTCHHSGSLSLDFALGKGGLPLNRIVEIVGAEGGGKTTLALLAAREWIEAFPDRVVLYFDLEHKLTPEWAAKLMGQEAMEKLIIVEPESMEQATDIYREFVPQGDVSMAIIDSIGGAPTSRVMDPDRSAEKANVAGNAYAVTQFARFAANLSAKFDCFAYETPVLTREGVRQIGELAGGTHEVIDSHGDWVEAPFKSYGEQGLLKITVQRNGREREFFATPKHRWFVDNTRELRSSPGSDLSWEEVDRIRASHSAGASFDELHEEFGLSKVLLGRIVRGTSAKEEQRLSGRLPLNIERKVSEVVTEELEPGMRLLSSYSRNRVSTTNPSPFGIAHGVTFGDGSRSTSGGGSHVVLYGEKDKNLLPYFAGCRTKEVRQEAEEDGRGIRVDNLPRFFKEPVDLTESTSYLYGWLAGYFAADGSVSKKGDVILSSASRFDIGHAYSVCQLLGIKTSGIASSRRTVTLPQGGENDVTMFTLNMDAHSLTELFFCVPEHRDRWRSKVEAGKSQRPDWVVVSVEETDRVEEVYCAEVPSTQSFTLDGNILTGNCLTIGINQMRDNMTPMSFALNTPGGRGWKHACVARIQLSRGKEKFYDTVNGEKIQVGYDIKARVFKNQLSTPFRTANWNFFNQESEQYGPVGIDTAEECLRLATLVGVVEKRGGWLYHADFPDGGKINGDKKFRELLENDREFKEDLINEVQFALAHDESAVSQVAPVIELDDEEALKQGLINAEDA